MLNSERNQGIKEYLQSLRATQANDYTLWKATKRLKQPEISISPIRSSNGKWARSAIEKADAFAQHLAEVFTPHPVEAHSEEEEDEIHRPLNEPYQLELPLHNFKKNEVAKIIRNNLNPKKAPGYDLITGQILQNLPEEGCKF